MGNLKKMIRAVADESGATAIEYALIGCLIAVVSIGSMTALGNSAVGLFGTIGAAMGGGSGDGGAGVAGGGASAGGGFSPDGIVSAGSGVQMSAF